MCRCSGCVTCCAAISCGKPPWSICRKSIMHHRPHNKYEHLCWDNCGFGNLLSRRNGIKNENNNKQQQQQQLLSTSTVTSRLTRTKSKSRPQQRAIIACVCARARADVRRGAGFWAAARKTERHARNSQRGAIARFDAPHHKCRVAQRDSYFFIKKFNLSTATEAVFTKKKKKRKNVFWKYLFNR